MTQTENEELVLIHPKYLRLMQAHLSVFCYWLCKQVKEEVILEEINELDWLDYVIDTLLEAHCNDTDC